MRPHVSSMEKTIKEFTRDFEAIWHIQNKPKDRNVSLLGLQTTCSDPQICTFSVLFFVFSPWLFYHVHWFASELFFHLLLTSYGWQTYVI